jgi:hypothetical protein
LQISGGGTVIFNTDAGAGGGNLPVVSNAFVKFGASQHLGSLNVTGGQTHLLTGGSSVLVTAALSVDTSDALIDIWEHAVIVDHTGTSPLASIKPAIASAYNNGAWNGLGITSSLADSNNFGIGYAEATALGLTSFAGEPIDGAALLMRLSRYGDANLDMIVDARDLGALASHWQGNGQTWTGGDFNYDGTVNIQDLYLLAINWPPGAPLGTPLDPILASLGLPADQVPEPTAVFFCLIPPLLLRRRRFVRFLS